MFAPGRDGWGSRGGVGGGWRGSRGHGETTVAAYLVQDLTPRSLRPQGADLLHEQTTRKQHKQSGVLMSRCWIPHHVHKTVLEAKCAIRQMSLFYGKTEQKTNKRSLIGDNYSAISCGTVVCVCVCPRAY